MDIIHEILDDLVNGDIVDIQFIALDKKQQQVKGALELGKLYLIGSRTHIIRFSNAPSGGAAISQMYEISLNRLVSKI